MSDDSEYGPWPDSGRGGRYPHAPVLGDPEGGRV